MQKGGPDSFWKAVTMPWRSGMGVPPCRVSPERPKTPEMQVVQMGNDGTELREEDGFFLPGGDGGAQFLKTQELSGAFRGVVVRALELRRMVADLLEARQDGQDQHEAGGRVRFVQHGVQRIYLRLVQGGLFRREGAVGGYFRLVRQVGDQGRIRLHPAQDERGAPGGAAGHSLVPGSG